MWSFKSHIRIPAMLISLKMGFIAVKRFECTLALMAWEYVAASHTLGKMCSKIILIAKSTGAFGALHKREAEEKEYITIALHR